MMPGTETQRRRQQGPEGDVEQRHVLLAGREEVLMERIEVVDGTAEQVVADVTGLGQHQGIEYALQTDGQGHRRQETGRRCAQEQRQAPGQPQDQHGQRRHQEAGGKAKAEVPLQVQAIDGGGGGIEAHSDGHAPVAQAGERPQAQQSEEVNGRTVEEALAHVQPMTGEGNAPMGNIERVFLPGPTAGARAAPASRR